VDDRHLWILRPGLDGGDNTPRPVTTKSGLDEEMIEDADSRHEQFVDESERWHDDR